MRPDSPNDDIIIGYQWLATLDDSTCLKCAARDGLLYDKLDQPIGHKLPFTRGPGKIHRRCRCTVIHVTRSWPAFSKTIQRPSVADGKVIFVPGNTTYNEWLHDRTRGFQERVLGLTRSLIWSKYNLHLMDLLGDDGKPLKIAELVERYSQPLQRPQHLP